jgi:membrane-bound lytic murein transglycosylase D
MKLRRIQSLFGILAVTLLVAAVPASAQTVKRYQQMTSIEQTAFVAKQARRIARQMSGREYSFTTDFEVELQKVVDSYVRRIGQNGATVKGDLPFTLERGTAAAPSLTKAFKARNVSPLIGLYLPFIESEYVNIAAPNQNGAAGMFQFLPATGAQFGLSAVELLDVEKSADAAARYIAAAMKKFDADVMKESLALLAYNRGVPSVEQDVEMIVNQQNRACSICALTEERDRLDQAFQDESVHYVPRFFAVAIIGENPSAFGLQTPPLSSLK